MINEFLHECQTALTVQLKNDGLLCSDGATVTIQAAAFQQYIYQVIPCLLYKKTVTEVATLEKKVDELQLRYNLVGSAEKAFYEKTDNGKEYRYLAVETVIFHFTGETFRFLDWLLAHHRYMGLLEVFPAYWHELEQKPSFEISIHKVAAYLSKQFQLTK